MKKYIAAFIFVFLLSPLFAQPAHQTINKTDLQQEISLMFQREQKAYSQYKENFQAQYAAQELTQLLSYTHITNPGVSLSRFGKQTSPSFTPRDTEYFPARQINGRRKKFPVARAEKPWQIAMIISVDRRPVNETVGTLRWLVKQGYVRRATIVEIAEDAASTAEGTFHFIYAGPKGSEVERRKFSLNITSTELLQSLFKSMQTEDLYTGVIVNAHGSGMEILYGENIWMTLDELPQSLQAANLQTDVLDLQSCHMASLYTAYQLAQYQNVKYLIAASDFNYTSTTKKAYPLLQHLQYEPKTAAINATRHQKQLFNFDRSYEVNNALAMDLQPLYEPLNNWFGSYGGLIINSKKELEAQLHQLFKPKLGEVRSLHKIIRQQVAFLENKPSEEAEDQFSDGVCWNWNELKEEFIQNSNTLLDGLNNALLTQWCYSPQNNTVYGETIPPNIDCSDGISVTKSQLEQLVAENKKTLEDNSRCVWFR